jgi:Protein of unknown function (DUF3108)
MSGTRRGTGRTASTLACALVVAAALAPAAGPAQPVGGLPFSPGEACVYRGSTALGRIGTGTMAVDAEAVDGRSMYLLRFDFRGRIGPAGVEDRTRSWFDPASMASVRYTRRERSPIGSSTQDVRMDTGARRWESPDGQGGAMPTSAPLDELSFLYFIRTLPLKDGDVYNLARHYETARNPVVVRVVGRGTIRVPAGTFRTVEVEMRVKDPARYRGDGVIQLHLTDDARHVLVRMESSIPRAGRMVLSLQAVSPTCAASPVSTAASDD